MEPGELALFGLDYELIYEAMNAPRLSNTVLPDSDPVENVNVFCD